MILLIESFIKEIISPIVEHDRLYNTSLLETAIEFINNDGDFTECSKNLYVHENTIRYRINKIRDSWYGGQLLQIL